LSAVSKDERQPPNTLPSFETDLAALLRMRPSGLQERPAMHPGRTLGPPDNTRTGPGSGPGRYWCLLKARNKRIPPFHSRCYYSRVTPALSRGLLTCQLAGGSETAVAMPRVTTPSLQTSRPRVFRRLPGVTAETSYVATCCHRPPLNSRAALAPSRGTWP